jgi:hypothetical protein
MTMLFDDATRDALLAAAVEAEITREITTVDAAAWVLPKKLRKLLPTRLGYDQLASDLASLQALDDTEVHRALLKKYLDRLQQLATKTGFAAIDTVRTTRLGEPPRSRETVRRTIQPELLLTRVSNVSALYLELGAVATRGVGKLTVRGYLGGQPSGGSGRGTAWLLTPKHVVTCHHVLRVRKGEFPTDADLALQVRSAAFELRPEEPLQIDACPISWPDLDVAILELRDPVTQHPLICRSSALPEPHKDQSFAVNVIQFPGGGEKVVGVRANDALEVSDLYVSYFTDTEEGSSGSPCCDDQWRVIAIHAGAEARKTVEYLGRTFDDVNVGVRIDAVLGRLRTEVTTLSEACNAERDPEKRAELEARRAALAAILSDVRAG